ncbi:DUF805 domain-containing protein [Bombiscardovia coagulans]|uniref:DUF805 domain-containing protein n=1 Tax=Bombiscardovia coagulans TaxID=686666 RepID=A0A261ESL0_9BIFI|nr:DUF805 domain-containing protein [Bombiscardovia coagulans]OZG49843.1 hypothetical protein BOCO_0360 [Bombiscardovia coagulans]
MSIALFAKQHRRVELMKGYDAMPDATLQECWQRPFYLFARGKGRACRKELWMFGVFVAIMSQGLSRLFDSGALIIIPTLFSIVCCIPHYALMVRRSHDLMLSGWLALLPVGLTFLASVIVTCENMHVGDESLFGGLAIVAIVLAVLSQVPLLCFPSRYPKTVEDTVNDEERDNSWNAVNSIQVGDTTRTY